MTTNENSIKFFKDLYDTPTPLREGAYLRVVNGRIECVDLPENFNNDIAELHRQITELQVKVAKLEEHTRDE